MMHRANRHDLVRFDSFVFDPASGELRRNAEVIELRPMVATLLELFVRAEPGRIITREEVRSRLWPATVIDFETGINTCIRQLRDALGDTAEAPRYVQTVPRRGYRFLVPVTVEGRNPPIRSATISETNRSDGARRFSRRVAVLAAVAATIIVASIGWLRVRGGESTRVVAVAAMDTRGTIAEDRIARKIVAEMIAALGSSRPGGLETRPWAPGMRYDSVTRRIEHRGVPTDASFFVSGVVFEENGSVEVSMRLRNVKTGAEWWSERYARASMHVDTVATEVARRTATAVREAIGAQYRPSRPGRS